MSEKMTQRSFAQVANEKSRIIGSSYFAKSKDNVDGRCDFSKDRDRIIFSKAFRRLGHKTQVYTHAKGDHYRTRLTHTLEVAHIAQSIAKRLDLNVELCSAIAYGHDIGHTPFGHEGERALDNIMSGKDNLGGLIKIPFNHGGFKHNYNSVRTLTSIEKNYPGSPGMNLTWQTMEGIIKHTRFKKKGEFICRMEEYFKDYEDYFVEDGINLLDYDCPVTLEGQVVAISDEIAQRQHDLDDGFMDDSLNIDLRDFIGQLITKINSVSWKTVDVGNECICNDMKNDLEKIHDDLSKYAISEELTRSLIVRWILNYLIYDVSFQTKHLLEQSTLSEFSFKSNTCFTQKYVDFSLLGEEINQFFADYVSSRIVNSYEINTQDGKSIFLIRNLFKAYYKNPRQMPKYVLQNIFKKVKWASKDSRYIDKLFDSHLLNGNLEVIKKTELNKLIALLCIDLDASGSYLDGTGDENSKFYIEVVERLRNCDSILQPDSLDDVERFTYLLNHTYIFEICDYISGMTDNYCSSEYKKLFLV